MCEFPPQGNSSQDDESTALASLWESLFIRRNLQQELLVILAVTDILEAVDTFLIAITQGSGPSKSTCKNEELIEIIRFEVSHRLHHVPIWKLKVSLLQSLWSSPIFEQK
ncbi:hypothetical protein ACTXT7_014944 [Hymenolepis weldensis]